MTDVIRKMIVKSMGEGERHGNISILLKTLKSNSAMWSAYRKLRNQTNKEVKKTKSSYFQECINNNKDKTVQRTRSLLK